MSIIDLSMMSDKQYAFLTAKQKHVGFGGARGGGKSWSVRTKAKILAVSYPGIKILIVRSTFPELVSNHINNLVEELHGIAKYNKTEKVFTFPNGSIIKFGYCNADSHLTQYQGAEYDAIFLDEATNLQEMWIKKITACLRGVNNFPKHIFYTCNPGGPSHGYFRRLFVDKHYETGENPSDYTFIQALATDNKALMESQPDYIKQLEALPPKLREAWLYGRWDIFEGQFFEEFRTEPDVSKAAELGLEVDELLAQHRYTHVIEPFEPPPSWMYYRSYDWGFGKPFSCNWWAVDTEGTAYMIAELYGCNGQPDEGVKWTNDEQFAEIARLEREHPYLRGRHFYGVADPSIWDGSRGVSTAQTAEKHGIYFDPGVNARIPGWMQMHYRFRFDEEGRAKMYFFDTCKDSIRTLPTLMYSERVPEDLDTTGEDHAADSIRYFCMANPITPMAQTEAASIMNDPLDLLRKKKAKKRYY